MRSLNEDVFSSIKNAKNIVGTISTIFNGKSDAKSSNYLNGSVSQYAKNLVMTFPVLCDNTLSPDTASMICKANERSVTTMLQLLFGAMNIEANDGMKVLAQIHKNISTSMDVYEVIDKMNDVSNNAIGAAFETVKGTYGRESEAINEMVNELKYGNKKSFPVNSLSERSLNSYTITKQYNRIVVNEAGNKMNNTDMENIANKVAAELLDAWDNYSGYTDDKSGADYIYSEEFKQRINNIISTMNLSVEITPDQLEAITKAVREKLGEELGFEIKKYDLLSKKRDTMVKLVDTDVKKANELQPTLLQVNYSQKKENGDIELRTFLAGVKSRLVAVDSTDIIERLVAKNKTKINFLNFIRATTGEIGFFKDFLFAIDQAKLDSKNAVKKGEAAVIWNCLANRAAKNNNNKLKKLGNDASAITVLVLSQETVNYMKSVHKFDLEKMNNTKMICDAYNLMGIMIADDSIEAIKVYYVGNNNYERLAYSYMEKENNNSDYKKMVSLMGKMNTR